MITRQQFIQAIEAGITAAGPDLTEPQRDALRQVAVSAKVVTANFDGCPLTLAGIYNEDEGPYFMPVWSFIGDYDDMILGFMGFMGFTIADRIVIA